MTAFQDSNLDPGDLPSRPAGGVAPSGCPVCGGEEWNYSMSAHGLTFYTCGNCQLMRQQLPPPEASPATVRRTPSPTLEESTEEEFERARAYWRHLQALRGGASPEGRILLISSESELLLRAGRDAGFLHIERVTADELDSAPLAEGAFDAAIAVFAIERMTNPAGAIRRIHELLKPEGKLLMVAPLTNSWPAKVCRDAWTQLCPENRFYFSAANLQTALLSHGFHRIWIQPDRRRYSLALLRLRALAYPATWLTKSVRTFCGLVPAGWRNQIRVPVPTSAFIISATRTPLRARQKLSIVMPVYNEKGTFAECFQAVQTKELPGLDKEIVVVESNSRDGTRELVQQLCKGDGVQLILQDRAAGKGNAVRAGLRVVTGDIVLIQDADLEYDVNDYDNLVKPILQRRTAFVLGSRHMGSWKLRKFNDQPLVATFFNLGHLFFCTSLNLLFGQSMKDPFTMYKVFRTDCLHGLELECDRFDFDFEILIKLIRKGYKPLELPVNYNARSLNEGKKVTAIRDPLTWVRALIKFRFCKIGPPPEVVST